MYLGVRFLTGKDTWAHLRSRFGFATVARPGGAVIWLHAASIGELKSVRSFLRFLSSQNPDHRILVTTNNPTALHLASEWTELDLILQAAPMDFTRSVQRFLKYWHPVAFVNVEGELWPNRLATLRELQIPTVFINARLSEGSARRWKGLGLSEAMFAGVNRFFCQNTATAESLVAVGVDPAQVETIRNLKSVVDAEVPAEELAGMQRVFVHEKTFLAASTHKGEDEVVLAAFAKVRETGKGLKLILAPRHPGRSSEVERLVRQHGFSLAVRSKGQVPDANSDVYLADSLGDMPLLYSLAAITFVGGSLVPKGGHTPYEPAQFGSAIVSGPNVANFEAEFGKLQAGRGYRMITSDTEMAVALDALLDTPTREAQVADARLSLVVESDVQGLFRKMAAPLGLEGKLHERD